MLPLAQNPSIFGDSLIMAQRRIFNFERRLVKDSFLAKRYNDFIQEYISLGDMELSALTVDKPTYYLPHNSVCKVNSSTAKLLVIFDGSAESRSCLSLNDIMLRGPKI